MLYDYKCPKCGKETTVEMKLKDLDTAEIFCCGKKNKKHRKCKMVITQNYVIPKSTTWSNW